MKIDTIVRNLAIAGALAIGVTASGAPVLDVIPVTAHDIDYYGFPNATNNQPTWDAGAAKPTTVSGGNGFGFFTNRYVYLDFGVNFAQVNIVETWTNYRAYSNVTTSSAFASMWWEIGRAHV